MRIDVREARDALIAAANPATEGIRPDARASTPLTLPLVTPSRTLGLSDRL
jgi:hypothetical protein